MKEKIIWLTILQGWAMLLVVIGHVNLSGLAFDPNFPIATEIQHIIYSFHMPLFMCISGFLFFLTKIQREKSYGSVVIDKLKRLGVPFLFFTFAALFLKFAFNPFMARPVDLSITEIANAFLYPTSNPMAEMWFVMTLFIIFLLYPLLKFSLKNISCVLLASITVVILYFFFPKNIELFCISLVAKMLIWFYIGVLISKFEWYKKWDSWWVCAALISVFTICWYFDIRKFGVIPLLGIVTSFSLCLCVVHKLPNLFLHFRNYTYQIFLIAIFPQIFVGLIYSRIIMSATANLSIYLSIYLSMQHTYCHIQYGFRFQNFGKNRMALA
jgi:fucose 4-O-acetylase-like acetyltransferase